MSHSNHDTSDDATMHAIMTSLRACYGSLDEPNFHKVSETLRSGPYRPLVESLRSSEIEITDTTDLNNDVSVRLVLDRSGEQVGLALSGVGPYAALLGRRQTLFLGDAIGEYADTVGRSGCTSRASCGL